jgi:hypothetical protein
MRQITGGDGCTILCASLTCVPEVGVFWALQWRTKGENDMAMQSRSAVLRQEIESSLASRIPAALSPQAVQAPRLLPIGNDAVNTLLGGGLPIGGICEFTCPASAGRTMHLPTKKIAIDGTQGELTFYP